MNTGKIRVVKSVNIYDDKLSREDIIKNMYWKYECAISDKNLHNDYIEELELIKNGCLNITLDEFREVRRKERQIQLELNASYNEINILKEKLADIDAEFKDLCIIDDELNKIGTCHYNEIENYIKDSYNSIMNERRE